jgi:hypothetical protein
MDDPEMLQIAGETLLRLEVGQDCEAPSIKLAISTAKNCKIYPIKFADVVIRLLEVLNLIFVTLV